MLSSNKRSRFHYSWIIAAITFLTMLAAAGIRATPGVLIVPLEKTFGWSDATISLAIAINLVLFGLSGPFAAALMQRIGIKRVMVVALFLASGATALTIFMSAPWQLYLLWGVLVGLASGSLTGILAAIITNRWFVKNRGLVLGLLTASSATGQLVFLPTLATLTVNPGWRAAVEVSAGAAFFVAILVIIFMRERPQDIGLLPYGAITDEGNQESTENPILVAMRGLIRGLRSGDFWLLAGSFFICGATTNGLIGTHLIPASMDHGISEVTAASLLALIGIFDLIGTTASGWLSDRFDNRWLLCAYYGFRGISLLFLPYALGSGYVSLGLFIIFYGLDWVATVPPTTRLTSDIFGRQQVGIIYGWIFAAHQLGAASAAFGAGVARTWLGNYQITFQIAGLLCIVAAGMVIRIGRSKTQQVEELPIAAVLD